MLLLAPMAGWAFVAMAGFSLFLASTWLFVSALPIVGLVAAAIGRPELSQFTNDYVLDQVMVMSAGRADWFSTTLRVVGGLSSGWASNNPGEDVTRNSYELALIAGCDSATTTVAAMRLCTSTGALAMGDAKLRLFCNR